MGGSVISSQKTCISETYLLSLKSCEGCLFAREGPGTQLWHRAPLEWDLYLQTQTPGVGDPSSVFFAVNFTSLGFVSLLYNLEKCEINLAHTSFVLCTRRKLEPGLTICGIIKTVFVPPWLTLCLPLCFLLFCLFWLNSASLATTLSFTIPPLGLNAPL